MPGKKVIYAHGIHTGGGLRLLSEVLAVVEGNQEYIVILDERCRAYTMRFRLVCPIYFKPGMLGRLNSERYLSKNSEEISGVLSFNSLPFLFNIGSKTTVFFQNVNLINKSEFLDFVSFFKSFWFKRTIKNVDLVLVQTESVERMLMHQVHATCVVRTLLAKRFVSLDGDFKEVEVLSDQNKRFIFVADDQSHKNHVRLIESWLILRKKFANFNAELILTLPVDCELWRKISREYDLHDCQY